MQRDTKGLERERKQLPERQVAGGAHRRETQRHPHLAEQRLALIGREQPVPPRKEVRKIAVALSDVGGMVYPVHVGGDDEPAQYAVHWLGQRDVGVVEYRGDASQRDREEHGERGNAERGDQRHVEGLPDERLHGVVANRGSAIHVQVRVMDLVEAPEQRHRMEQSMLRIAAQIDRHHAQ